MINSIKKYLLSVSTVIGGLLSPFFAKAELPAGNPITFNALDNIGLIILQFLMSISIVALVISFVLSGIIVSYSGDDKTKFAKGLAMLKSTIWGAFIILGTGVIINTVAALVDRTFFCQIQVIGICLWS